MKDPARLESLFELDVTAPGWSDADLAGMLRHLMSQPLEAGRPTIREIIEQPDPPIESLQSLKRHAKLRRVQGDTTVPSDLWRVIYFASIAAAIRAEHRISDLSPAELSKGLQWTLALPWLDDAFVRQLVGDASRRFRK